MKTEEGESWVLLDGWRSRCVWESVGERRGKAEQYEDVQPHRINWYVQDSLDMAA